MAISTDAVIKFFGTSDDLSTTATTTTLATATRSAASDLDEWANDDDSEKVAFLLEIDDWSGAPTANSKIHLFAQLLNISGTNDEPVTDANYDGHFLYSFNVDNVDAAQYLVSRTLDLPAIKTSQEYQFIVDNQTGVTMGVANNGWRLKVIPISRGPHA